MSVLELFIHRGPSGYRASVVGSPAGPAWADITLDLDSLTARRAELERAVLLSADQSRDVFAEQRTVRDIGQVLFGALLGTGDVAGRYRAAEREGDLLIVLRTHDPALAVLPWEAMYDEESGGYLCQRHQLVRHTGVRTQAAPVTVDLPLRILGVVSPPLDAATEREQLGRALSGLTRAGLVELTWAPTATWADLRDSLRGGTWHVLHHAGGMGAADGKRFVDILGQANPMPRLAVLSPGSAPSPGPNGGTDSLSGAASALVGGGVTSVATLQFPVSGGATTAFARDFYGAIVRGDGVGEAMLGGRAAIGGQSLEWIAPVLYVNSQDIQIQPLVIAAVSARPRPRVQDQPVRTLDGHTSDVSRVAFSPDGTLLVTADLDGKVLVRVTATGAAVSTLTGHAGPVTSVAFHPNGRIVATAGQDTTVRLWHAVTGQPVSTHQGRAGGVLAVAFSPDGRLIAFTSPDDTVRVLEAVSGAPVRTVTGQTGPLGVTFSPDGTLLATTYRHGTIRLWDTATWAPARTVALDGDAAWSVAFSPDSASFAATSLHDSASVRDTATGALIRTLTGHTRDITSVAFSPDGTLLATTSSDHTARLWDTGTGAPAAILIGHAGVVTSAAFSPDGTLLATAGDDMTVRLWETR